MKKIAVIAFLIVASFSAQAQLNEDAKYLKEEEPKAYELIRASAIKEWKDNHEMIVYAINNQSKSLFE